MDVDVYDPWANPAEVKHEYGINSITEYPKGNGYGAIILAVAHYEFLKIDLEAYKKPGSIIYDVKGIFKQSLIDGKL